MTTPQQRFRQLYQDTDTFATTLLVMAVDDYGLEHVCGSKDVDYWSPEGLRQQIQQDYAEYVPLSNQHKLTVARMIIMSDDFYKRTDRFIKFCNVLSGDSLGAWSPATAEECAWGMTEAMILFPPDRRDPEPYSDEIRHYIGAILDQEGIITAPDLLRLGIRSTSSGTPDYSGMNADDPTMFAAGYAQQQSRSKDIEAMMKERLTELFNQLESLPLKHGNTKDLLKRIQGKLLES